MWEDKDWINIVKAWGLERKSEQKRNPFRNRRIHDPKQFQLGAAIKFNYWLFLAINDKTKIAWGLVWAQFFLKKTTNDVAIIAPWRIWLIKRNIHQIRSFRGGYLIRSYRTLKYYFF